MFVYKKIFIKKLNIQSLTVLYIYIVQRGLVTSSKMLLAKVSAWNSINNTFLNLFEKTAVQINGIIYDLFPFEI